MVKSKFEETIQQQLQNIYTSRKYSLKGMSNGLCFSYSEGSIKKNALFYIDAIIDNEGIKYDAYMLNL